MKKLFLIAVMFMVILLSGGCRDTSVEKESAPAAPAQTAVQTPADDSAVAEPDKAGQISDDQTTAKPTVTGTVYESGSSSAAQSKSLSWYFVRNQQHQTPGANAGYKQLLEENQSFYVLPNDSKKIYLTFDCGYEQGYGGQVLDTLAAKNVKAAFFITGQYLKTQPELIKRMKAEGHLVCSHSYNHPDLSAISQSKVQQEITSLADGYRSLTGLEMDKYLRPPAGKFSANSLQWTKELGYSSVFWSMAWQDWDPKNQPGADYVYQHVLDNIHPGAVILMHIVSESDTEALEQIITDLQDQGYRFSTFGN